MLLILVQMVGARAPGGGEVCLNVRPTPPSRSTSEARSELPDVGLVIQKHGDMNRTF